MVFVLLLLAVDCPWLVEDWIFYSETHPSWCRAHVRLQTAALWVGGQCTCYCQSFMSVGDTKLRDFKMWGTVQQSHRKKIPLNWEGEAYKKFIGIIFVINQESCSDLPLWSTKLLWIYWRRQANTSEEHSGKNKYAKIFLITTLRVTRMYFLHMISPLSHTLTR